MGSRYVGSNSRDNQGHQELDSASTRCTADALLGTTRPGSLLGLGSLASQFRAGTANMSTQRDTRIDEGANIPPIKVYPDKYEGQVVAITGAAQGIGEVTSKLFASQGATVIMIDLQKEKLDKVLTDIKSKPGKGEAAYRVCDISKEAEASALIDEVVKTFGKIDVLIQLAALYPFIPFVNHPTDMYKRIMEVNVDACFYLCRAVLPHMQKAGYGRLINTLREHCSCQTLGCLCM